LVVDDRRHANAATGCRPVRPRRGGQAGGRAPRAGG